MSKKRLIVAIDGPAGSGKSTVARRLAEDLGLPYIDTGAMYRSLTALAMRQRVAWDDATGLARLARKAVIDLRPGKGRLRVVANGRDVTREIRTPELTKRVHRVANLPAVRASMVRLQRALGRRRGGVLEGRDIGTVVFPRAPFKFYLDADFGVRALRRWRELRTRGERAGLPAVRRDLRERDGKDFRRKVGGLRRAPDAVRIDTTALTIQETVDIIWRIIALGRRRSPPRAA
jgi:cytidylate kinase